MLRQGMRHLVSKILIERGPNRVRAVWAADALPSSSRKGQRHQNKIYLMVKSSWFPQHFHVPQHGEFSSKFLVTQVHVHRYLLSRRFTL